MRDVRGKVGPMFVHPASGLVAAAALLFTWRVMMSAPRLLNKELSRLCIYWMDGQHLYPEKN